MKGFSTLWQRYPGLFALGLAALTIGGFIAMLSDTVSGKRAGFFLSTLPSLLTVGAYLNQSRQRRF